MVAQDFASPRNPADYHPLSRAEELLGKQLFQTGWMQAKRKHMTLFHDAIEANPEDSDVTICLSNPEADNIMDGMWTMSMVVNFHFNHNPIWSPGMWALFHGIEKARFPQPLFVGQCIRCTATLIEVREHRYGRIVVSDNLVEIQGEERPALIATTSALFRIGAMPGKNAAGPR